jgi:hypothetical protein
MTIEQQRHEQLVIALRAVVESSGADCYSTNVERERCMVLLKRRRSRSEYIVVRRLRVTHQQRGSVEQALEEVLGWHQDLAANG